MAPPGTPVPRGSWGGGGRGAPSDLPLAFRPRSQAAKPQAGRRAPFPSASCIPASCKNSVNVPKGKAPRPGLTAPGLRVAGATPGTFPLQTQGRGSGPLTSPGAVPEDTGTQLPERTPPAPSNPGQGSQKRVFLWPLAACSAASSPHVASGSGRPLGPLRWSLSGTTKWGGGGSLRWSVEVRPSGALLCRERNSDCTAACRRGPPFPGRGRRGRRAGRYGASPSVTSGCRGHKDT